VKKLYGIDVEDVKRMEIAQDFCCAICKERRRLAIDHDHETGKIRSLLCGKCNTGIGQFDENPDLLLKAAEYVKRFRVVVTTP
jgi:hypothetical protein